MNARRKGEIMDTETNAQTPRQKPALAPKTILDMSMSLDGFVAGSNGESGGRLQDWIFDGGTERSGASALSRAKLSHREIVDESFETTGAVVMGRRWFEILNKFWGDGPPHFQVPCFVITHHAQKKISKGNASFTFVTDGIGNALAQAKRPRATKTSESAVPILRDNILKRE
jgi:dihydrofolate reductase